MPPKPTTLETQIDENLRLIFEEDAEAELPPRLRALLEQLDEIDAPAGPGEAGTDGKRGSQA